MLQCVLFKLICLHSRAIHSAKTSSCVSRMHYSCTLPERYHKPEQISKYLTENAATVLHFIFSFIMLLTLKRIELGDRLNEEAYHTSKALLLPPSLHAWPIMTPSIVSVIESHHLLCHSQLHPECNTLVKS